MKWRKYALLFLIIIFFGVGLWVAIAQAPTKPQIVFSMNDDIYVMDTDGTNVRRLTYHPTTDSVPSWSPDGRQIAFTSHRNNVSGAYNTEVYVMDSDGTNIRRLTHHLGVDAPASWSPDGKQIAFVSERDGNFEIYVMTPDGANLRNLTQHPSIDTAPSWSPDGRQIVFASNRRRFFEEFGHFSGTDLYVMNADGSDVRRLTGRPGAPHQELDMTPCWSPDGKRIVFTSFRGDAIRDGGSYDIYVMDADGNNQKNISPSLAWEMDPCWSSDGEQIVFAAVVPSIPVEDLPGKGNTDIYVMNRDGSDVRRLTEHLEHLLTAGWPRWFAPKLVVSVSSKGKRPSTWGRLKTVPCSRKHQQCERCIEKPSPHRKAPSVRKVQ